MDTNNSQAPAVEYWSLRQWAAHHGKSKSAATKAVREGRVKTIIVDTYHLVPAGTPWPTDYRRKENRN